MGCSSWYTDSDEYKRDAAMRPRRREQAFAGIKARLDCKELTLRACATETRIAPIRGYALFDDAFTEHWWGIDGDKIIDTTGISSIASLVPLDEQGEPQTVCMAYRGPCEQSPSCEWCKAREALEAKGFRRAPLETTFRPLLDRALRENQALRNDLDTLIRTLCRVMPELAQGVPHNIVNALHAYEGHTWKLKERKELQEFGWHVEKNGDCVVTMKDLEQLGVKVKKN